MTSVLWCSRLEPWPKRSTTCLTISADMGSFWRLGGFPTTLLAPSKTMDTNALSMGLSNPCSKWPHRMPEAASLSAPKLQRCRTRSLMNKQMWKAVAGLAGLSG